MNNVLNIFQGTYSSEGSESCTKCNDGEISSTEGAIECTACGDGETAKDMNTKCEICPSVSIYTTYAMHTHNPIHTQHTV